MSDISSRNTSDLVMDCSPLSQACIKALTDRLDDKRKFAANEIEKMTVKFSMSNNMTMVNKLINVLGRKFCLSHHQNTRKGGLLGLAAVMVGYKNGSNAEPTQEMVEEVIRPILTCLLDSDSRVRYYACESLYNVTKVAGPNVLPLFESIFDSLTRLVTDPDLNVRVGSETLDRLLKDIIVESPSDALDIEGFVAKLEEYIYTKNPFTRMLIISWIRLFDTKVDMINYLARLLDGILNCLYDSTEEICASTLVLLSEFLNKIVNRPTDELDMPSIINTLLKHARNDREDPVQYTAITWLRQFIRLMDGPELLNFAPNILSAILPCLAYQAGDDSLTPAMAAGEQHHSVHHRHQPATSTNTSQLQHSRSAYNIPPFSAANQGNICDISLLVNSSLQELVIQIFSDKRRTTPIISNATSTDVDFKQQQQVFNELEAIIDVLAKELRQQEHPVIKLAVLDWFKALKKAEPTFILTSVSQQKLFNTLLETLSARSDTVVKNTLRVMTELFCDDSLDEQQQQQHRAAGQADDIGTSSGQQQQQTSAKEESIELNVSEGTQLERKKSPAPKSTVSSARVSSQPPKGTPGSKRAAIAFQEPPSSVLEQPRTNFHKFIQALYKTFHENELMFEDRSKFIIVNLCSMTKPETVYRSFADIIRDEKSDSKFAYNLVQKLNQILLTAPALFNLRCRLSNSCLEGGATDMVNLSNTLLVAWSQSPTASVTLCLLTGNYKQAKDLVMSLSKCEVTMEMLIQVDWIVQLIESPIFSALRLRLVDSTSNNQYLVQTLYGLLMILPQSEAYKKLSHRLDQVHKFMSISQRSPLSPA